MASTPALAEAQVLQSQTGLPFLHPLFSDNAVLQRDRKIPVWGWTTPGEKVTVALDTQTITTQADAKGQWRVEIGPFPAGGPHTLRVSSPQQGEVVRQNILVGDVWLCAGQSNMELGVRAVNNAQEEIAKADYPQLRLLTVPWNAASSPQKTADIHWVVCNSSALVQSGISNGFSAVGFFFGRKLNQELDVPIGLIQASWAGTMGESWMSDTVFNIMPDIAPQVTDFHQMVADNAAKTEEWRKANDTGLKENWGAMIFADKNWQWLGVPTLWNSAGDDLKAYDGFAWYRTEVNVSKEWLGHDLTLKIGPVDDEDVTYWNGVPLGSGYGWTVPRAYKIPASQVKAGRNVIAIEVYDQSGDGGIGGGAEQTRLELNANTFLPIAGQWKFKISTPIAQTTAHPPFFDPGNPNFVSAIYNGMVAPLEPYGIKGAIWYQGEANAGRAEQYSRLLPTLINDWRQRFNTPLSFYIVQLAGYMAPDDTPRNDDWPQLRNAQLKTAQTVPHTGIAITTDIGDQNDLHPKDKQDVGLRLALNALAKDYGKPVEYSGPTLKTVAQDGANLVLTFDHSEDGLTLKGEADKVFALAGADGNWFWATPHIEGNRVILTSPDVPKPTSVRFGWSNLPRANLYNGAHLPAAPFQASL